jgi:hypothetical protein
MGHLDKYCKNGHVSCYECGALDHFKNNFPKIATSPSKKLVLNKEGDDFITYDDSHVIITHRREALDQAVVDEDEGV